jgi:hypothetical protein
MTPSSSVPPPDLGFPLLSDRGPQWWLRARLGYLLDELETIGVICEHVAANPVGGVSALWAPNTVTCERPECLDVFRIGLTEDCDRCHAQSGDITGYVWHTELRSFRLVLMFGLCPACASIELHK